MTQESEIQVTSDVAVSPKVTTRLFECEKYPKYDTNEVIKIDPVTGAFEAAETTTGCR